MQICRVVSGVNVCSLVSAFKVARGYILVRIRPVEEGDFGRLTVKR